MRRPVVTARTGHVDDGKFWIDLSGSLGDFPAVYSAAQIDISHKRPVLAVIPLQQGHRLVARCSYCSFKAAFGQGIFNNALYGLIIFDDYDDKQLFQLLKLPTASEHDAYVEQLVS